jgi:amino acid adenylation domain-containing protein/thioester reductase-like protein
MNSIQPVSANYGFGPVSELSSHDSLDDIFRRQANLRPDAIAAVYGAQELSYAALNRRADRLAAHLKRSGIRSEEPIGILLDPSLNQIVSQLAVIRAGGSCLPLDPGAPDDRLEFMLADLDARTVITTAAWEHRVGARDRVLIEDYDACPSVMSLVKSPEDNGGLDQRTHILFTSGTTGQPKAVQIMARGIVRLTSDPTYVSLNATDRIAAIANPTFDASLFEIWGALSNGGTIVLLPKQAIIDPYAFRHSLDAQRVTSMFITATLFNQTVHVCPDAFRGLRHLLVGGEALNPRTLREVLRAGPPRRLLNGYGPTECTTFALCHEISMTDLDADSVPIGKPIDNTQVFVLDDLKRPLSCGQIGEIYIGGDGVARGYWNRPDLNAERFVDVDGLIDGQSVRLYKTGDLGSWRADGVLKFHGRNDNQVKIRGHRIELEEVELALLASNLLQAAVVTVQQTELGDNYLMAFVIPERAAYSEQGHVAHPDVERLGAQLADYLKSRLPLYMRPRIKVVMDLPMNANGKVDRRALVRQLDIESVANSQTRIDSDGAAPSASTQTTLASLWRRALDAENIGDDDNFFALGGDSLQAAGLVFQVSKHFNYPLPVQALYDHPTPAKMALYLDARHQLNGGFTTADEIRLLLADTHLPNDIQPLQEKVPNWRTAGCGFVFMTGATGFLGAFVLRDLLRIPEVQQVACLVRATSDRHAMVRIQENMTKYGLWEETFLDRLLPLAGDLAEEDLGLGGARFDALSRQSDVIFHLGAHVNYIQPYGAHRLANVTGTINVLRFATTGKPKPLHYSSTIAAFGPTGLLEPTAVVYEDDDMAKYLTGLKFDSGYSQSQWVAEQIVWEAARRGVPLAVYRPGFIMGDSRTGAGNPNDFVARLVKGCIALGCRPMLGRQSKQFVPVDYVSEALLRIASDNDNLSRAYHLVPPQSEGDPTLELGGFFELLGQCGFPLEAVPYPQWVRRLADSDELKQNPLMPLVPMLMEPVYGELTRWEVYEGMPIYDSFNTKRALAAYGGNNFPHVDSVLLRRYLDYWTQIGFLEKRSSAPENSNSRLPKAS